MFINHNDGGSHMKFLKNKGELNTGSDGNFIITGIYKIVSYPYLLVSTIGMKLPFLKKEIIERVFSVAIIISLIVTGVSAAVRIRTKTLTLLDGNFPLIVPLLGTLIMIVGYVVFVLYDFSVYDQTAQLLPIHQDGAEVTDQLMPSEDVKDDLEDLDIDLGSTESTEGTESDYDDSSTAEDLIDADDVVNVSDMNDLIDDLGLDLLDSMDTLTPFDNDESDITSQELFDTPVNNTEDLLSEDTVEECPEVVGYQNRNQAIVEELLNNSGISNDLFDADIESRIEQYECVLPESVKKLVTSESVIEDDFETYNLLLWEVPSYYQISNNKSAM